MSWYVIVWMYYGLYVLVRVYSKRVLFIVLCNFPILVFGDLFKMSMNVKVTWIFVMKIQNAEIPKVLTIVHAIVAMKEMDTTVLVGFYFDVTVFDFVKIMNWDSFGFSVYNFLYNFKMSTNAIKTLISVKPMHHVLTLKDHTIVLVTMGSVEMGSTAQVE